MQLCFSVRCVHSVGIGDLAPVTTCGRLVSFLSAVFGIITLASLFASLNVFFTLASFEWKMVELINSFSVRSRVYESAASVIACTWRLHKVLSARAPSLCVIRVRKKFQCPLPLLTQVISEVTAACCAAAGGGSGSDVHVKMYAYICMYVCMFVCTHVGMYVCMWVFVYVCTCELRGEKMVWSHASGSTTSAVRGPYIHAEAQAHGGHLCVFRRTSHGTTELLEYQGLIFGCGSDRC
jgi:hypothetical protein